MNFSLETAKHFHIKHFSWKSSHFRYLDWKLSNGIHRTWTCAVVLSRFLVEQTQRFPQSRGEHPRLRFVSLFASISTRALGLCYVRRQVTPTGSRKEEVHERLNNRQNLAKVRDYWNSDFFSLVKRNNNFQIHRVTRSLIFRHLNIIYNLYNNN